MIRGTSSVAERTEVFEAGIGRPIPASFPKTAELVGKRIHWSYGGTHKFEHIYIEPELYCWHGIKGPEANMGAVEPTTVRKIADNLYLFSWCDRAIPFNGALVIDLIDTPSSAGRPLRAARSRARPAARPLSQLRALAAASLPAMRPNTLPIVMPMPAA